MKLFALLRWAASASVLFAAAQQAQAAVSCGYFNTSRGFNGTMPLAVSTIVVPRDLPLGRIIYTQQFLQAGTGVEFECDTLSATLTPYLQVTNVGAQTGFQMAVYGYNVFKTDVPGIGVVWWGGVFGAGPMTTTMTAGDPVAAGCTRLSNDVPDGKCRTNQLKFSTTAAMTLVKTGPVGAGVINASSLGKLVMAGKFADSVIYSVATLGMRGSIAVVSQTCTTPNVNVPLGRRQVSSLKGIGSATPQINFSIALTNCPAFTGLLANARDSTSVSQDAVLGMGAATRNILRIRFDPGSTAINAPNGVLSLSAPVGVISASGVGVQLLDATGTPRALSEDIAVNGQLGTSMTIAMGARYIQTAAKVTPGVANAVATYTLIYQ